MGMSSPYEVWLIDSRSWWDIRINQPTLNLRYCLIVVTNENMGQNHIVGTFREKKKIFFFFSFYGKFGSLDRQTEKIKNTGLTDSPDMTIAVYCGHKQTNYMYKKGCVCHGLLFICLLFLRTKCRLNFGLVYF